MPASLGGMQAFSEAWPTRQGPPLRQGGALRLRGCSRFVHRGAWPGSPDAGSAIVDCSCGAPSRPGGACRGPRCSAFRSSLQKRRIWHDAAWSRHHHHHHHHHAHSLLRRSGAVRGLALRGPFLPRRPAPKHPNPTTTTTHPGPPRPDRGPAGSRGAGTTPPPPPQPNTDNWPSGCLRGQPRLTSEGGLSPVRRGMFRPPPSSYRDRRRRRGGDNRNKQASLVRTTGQPTNEPALTLQHSGAFSLEGGRPSQQLLDSPLLSS